MNIPSLESVVAISALHANSHEFEIDITNALHYSESLIECNACSISILDCSPEDLVELVGLDCRFLECITEISILGFALNYDFRPFPRLKKVEIEHMDAVRASWIIEQNHRFDKFCLKCHSSTSLRCLASVIDSRHVSLAGEVTVYVRDRFCGIETLEICADVPDSFNDIHLDGVALQHLSLSASECSLLRVLTEQSLQLQSLAITEDSSLIELAPLIASPYLRCALVTDQLISLPGLRHLTLCHNVAFDDISILELSPHVAVQILLDDLQVTESTLLHVLMDRQVPHAVTIAFNSLQRKFDIQLLERIICECHDVGEEAVQQFHWSSCEISETEQCIAVQRLLDSHLSGVLPRILNSLCSQASALTGNQSRTPFLLDTNVNPIMFF